MTDLEPRQQRFVDEYIKEPNGTQAALRAGYSAKGASVAAARLLANDKIRAAVDKGMARVAAKAEVTAERVIRELAIIAFGTLDEIASWDENGPRLLPSEELTRDQRAMVASIKVKRERQVRGRGEEAEPWEVENFEIKPWDKLKALELLGKRLGLFSDTTVTETHNTLVVGMANQLSMQELMRLSEIAPLLDIPEG